MGMTMTQKILAAHAGLDQVKAGEFIEADLDLVLGNDITSPGGIEEYKKMTSKGVFDKDKICVVMDHFMPAKDIKSANQGIISRDFCRDQEISHFYDVGEAGIEHALLPEKGLVVSGDLVIGADSHTCTYGALGAVSTGVGSTDMGAAMATGKAWFRVPSAILFKLKGKRRPYVSGKDVILHIIGMIGVDGARYKSMEFVGEGVDDLEIEDRLTISNMAIEAGAKNGIFPVDQKTIDFMEDRGRKDYKVYEADPDAEYEEVYEIDLSQIKPTVAFPHLPENTHNIEDIEKIYVDQVVIGSCTNGNFKDMKEAADIMKGHKKSEKTRVIVIPATQKIYKKCIEEGLAETFIEFGAVFSTPTCGPCLGGYMGIIGDDEKCLSTTNRNFVGRMGAKSSEVYLANPQTAAATAINGYISTPDMI